MYICTYIPGLRGRGRTEQNHYSEEHEEETTSDNGSYISSKLDKKGKCFRQWYCANRGILRHLKCNIRNCVSLFFMVTTIGSHEIQMQPHEE